MNIAAIHNIDIRGCTVSAIDIESRLRHFNKQLKKAQKHLKKAFKFIKDKPEFDSLAGELSAHYTELDISIKAINEILKGKN